jgi:cytidylate kinase
VITDARREFDSWAQARDELANRLVTLSDGGQSAILLIDGRSGSGKTTFAAELAEAVFADGESAARVVHMDDLYPGWDGLRDGSRYLVQQILEPLARGRSASWQLWNWARSERGRTGEVGNGWREFAGGTPLIIEGCGSISRTSVELAQLSLWVEAEQPIRRQRWKERDGDRFAAHWPRWAVQEDEFYQDERSRELAAFELRN